VEFVKIKAEAEKKTDYGNIFLQVLYQLLTWKLNMSFRSPVFTGAGCAKPSAGIQKSPWEHRIPAAVYPALAAGRGCRDEMKSLHIELLT